MPTILQFKKLKIEKIKKHQCMLKLADESLMKNRIFTKTQSIPTIFALIKKTKSNYRVEKSGRHTLAK